MGSEGVTVPPAPEWASEACIMGIDEAGRGPVLGPMVYASLYCPLSYQNTLSTLSFADSKTLKEDKREELFEALKENHSIGWAVDVIDPKELSAKMLKKNKINLNEISHDSAMGLVDRVLKMGVLLTEVDDNYFTLSVHDHYTLLNINNYKQILLMTPLNLSRQVYIDTVGDPGKYETKISNKFPSIKFVVAKKADSLYPVVSGASIVAKVTRDRAVREWVLDETADNMHRNFGSGYPGDPATKSWLEHHKHPIFGFPTLVRFSWGTCSSYFKGGAEVLWESDLDEDGGSNNNNGKRQLKLNNMGFTTSKRRTEEIESSGKGRSRFFQARKLEHLTHF